MMFRFDQLGEAVAYGESLALDALRDTLLPKLLSVELRVSTVVKTMVDNKAAEHTL